MTSKTDNWLHEQKQTAAKPLRQLGLLAPITGILIVAQAWLLAHVIDLVAFGHADLAQVWPWMLALLPVFGLRFVLNWKASRLGFQAARLVKADVRHHLLNKLRQLGPVALANENSGDLAARLIDGIEALDGYFSRYLPAMTLMSMVPLVILLVVFPSDWLSGLVLLVTAPLVPLFMSLIGKGAERRNQAQWRTLTRMGSHFLNVIQTLPTLKAFNASRRELHNIARISEEFRRATMSVLYLAFLTSAVLEFFASISIAIIAVFIGFRLLDGEMAFFYGFFVLLLAPEFYLPLRNFGVQNHARMEAAGAAEKLAEIFEKPESETAAANEQDIDFQGQVRIQGVHFAYDRERQALDGLDLVIAPGEHVAIVGTSGSGKSTLANLLLGFIQAQQGEVLIGDHALTPANAAAWRRRISWIPQKARLFHGTVLDNIRLGIPDASINAVLNACEAANAMTFISALPHQLDTLVGEGGHELSGGQAQRIAIARAVVRNTPWLLLDEPSAHLDHDSERQVTQALQRLARGRTTVTIAHRLQTVRDAGRIVVMQNGRIVQDGRYEQLADRPGTFRELLDAGKELDT